MLGALTSLEVHFNDLALLQTFIDYRMLFHTATCFLFTMVYIYLYIICVPCTLHLQGYAKEFYALFPIDWFV